MLRSLYSGVSGLTSHQTKMDVIGNNIANVNTYGFKSSRVTFADIFYQDMKTATSGNATVGGNNPSQVGYGVSVGTIDVQMSRSGFQTTSNGLDLALAGEGFFQVQDKSGNLLYTRAGIFNIDDYGNLVDSSGNFVLGVTGDPTNVNAASDKIQIIVPDVTDASASAVKTLYGMNVNFDVQYIGSEGNMSVTYVNGTPPTATLSGGNLTVTFDQNAEYNSMAELQSAIDDAIRAGGITLPSGQITLSTDDVPANTAQAASNYVNLSPTNRLTIEAGDEGASGNQIKVQFQIVAGATTDEAVWNDNTIVFKIREGETYSEADLQALATSAGGTGVKDIQITLDSDATAEELAANPVQLTGGDNTFYENIAKSLGTVKLDGGRLAGAQSVGSLTSLSIGNDGVITANHPVHGAMLLGRIDVVTFDNPSGLTQQGNTTFAQTVASGNPKTTIAGYNGSGAIVSGALEMSNVDLAQEFADMITTQRGFQANSRIITTSDEMLQELVNLKR